ncbi:MAG: efflux RND transporter periplasmic adaptor subunit [Desulfobacterales bacterium]|nr:efflux RND transporter periplasmic adaptor subunit [Desulfobacterales bacterium]
MPLLKIDSGIRYFKKLILFLMLFVICSCTEEKSAHMTFSGIMDADITRVSSQTHGIIKELKINEGMEVGQGQTLANIETESLGYQLEQNRSAIEELGNQYNATLSQLETAKIEKENIGIKYNRFSALLQSKATSQQNVDDLKTQLDAANERIKSIQSSMDVVISKRKQVESGAKLIKKQVKDATITSPFSGRVLVRYVEKGELLAAGSPVCDIADLSLLWTKIYIEEKNLPFIKLGQNVLIKIDGIDDKTLEGRVSWISDKSEFTPKTILTEETKASLVFSAKIIVPNNNGILKIGMPVSVIVQRQI